MRSRNTSSLALRTPLLVLTASLIACGSDAAKNVSSAERGENDAAHADAISDPGSNDPGSDEPGEQEEDGGASNGGDVGIDGGTDADSGSTAEGGEGDAGGSSACVAAPSGWRSMASAPDADAQVSFFEATWTGREMLVLGTHRSCADGPSCNHDVGYAYAPSTNTWRALPPSPFADTNRTFDATAWTGTQWLLFGGMHQGMPVGADFDGYAFDPSTGAWTTIPSPPLPYRTAMRGLWSPATKQLVVVGGVQNVTAPESEFADGAAYDPATRTWRKITDAPVAGIFDHLAWSGGRMVAIFLRSSAACDDCTLPVAWSGTYDPVSDAWTTLPTAPIVPRIYANVAAIGPGGAFAAIILGTSRGGDGDFATFKDGAYWDSTAARWQTMPRPFATEALDGRDGVTTWSANGKLYAWGGEEFPTDVSKTPFSYRDDGASFDPAAGAWSPMPSGGPSARQAALAVWTGCDAIVFGGFGPTVATFGSGKLFRP